MDFRGQSEISVSLKYVRRSMALRNQKSAYDSMRRAGVLYVKQGGTAGVL